MPRKLLASAAIALLFISLSLAQGLTRIPFCDEAWLASASRNLLTNGRMGTSYIETAGTWAKNIDLYTYWVMPLYPVTQTLWYTIVGFGLQQMRLASLVWGLIAIAAWMSVILRLHGSWRAAVFTGVLIGCDYYFVGSSATGRMDLMSAALGVLAWAVYLHERERHLGRAILLSHCLAAASVFTHPNAIGELFCLLILIFYFDRRRIRLLHFQLAALPYLLIAGGWGIYIARDPSAWRSQLLGNIAAGREHWGLVYSMKTELSRRYLGAYGFGPHSSMAAHAAVLIAIAYAIAVLALVAWRRLRREQGAVLLFVLITVLAISLLLFEPKKSPMYLVHVVPGYDAALGVFLASCWSLASWPRFLAAVTAASIVALQLGANVRTIYADSYTSLYVPAVQFLRTHTDARTTIMGNAELAFGLGFPGNLRDDYRLGFFTGVRPEVIVVDTDYQYYFEAFRSKSPAIYAHILKQLSACSLEYHSAAFQIYTGCVTRSY